MCTGILWHLCYKEPKHANSPEEQLNNNRTIIQTHKVIHHSFKRMQLGHKKEPPLVRTATGINLKTSVKRWEPPMEHMPVISSLSTGKWPTRKICTQPHWAGWEKVWGTWGHVGLGACGVEHAYNPSTREPEGRRSPGVSVVWYTVRLKATLNYKVIPCFKKQNKTKQKEKLNTYWAKA